MNRLLVSILGAGLLVSASAFAQTSTDYIVGGTPAEEGKWPWQVRILEDVGDTYGFCGGSIIAPDWILTAAHCVYDQGQVTPNLVVGYGSTNREKLTKIASKKVIAHPDYAFGGKADVALIQLSEPIPGAKPIAIADAAAETKVLAPGVTATVTGWGALWDFKTFEKAVFGQSGARNAGVDTQSLLNMKEMATKYPLMLHEVKIQLVDPKYCQEAYAEVGLTVSGAVEICAGGDVAIKDACFGDSGGPLMVASEDGSGFVQVGVVSWGLQCGNPAFPTLYARVAGFNDWIRSTMDQNK